ncbi:hypothetical protein I302_105251 [Kwoniella bestiolae CBS 10118]|uniref:Uncharacterized protein n=1 Tax=Kwoniella bestiolae CBS 10118 TaxID=1296100 RepID=A0A1B9FSN5_9TREE|nr:hypothetical protein I302_08539 [Kwoniella bestiolae CBS 10118]OCF21760.1 hypothetical protein I302_08539 [Kwoniella bestiolae CBS 10118]
MNPLTTLLLILSTSLFLFLTPTLARVSSITLDSPTAIHGQNISITTTSYSHIQNWEDFGIVWGLLRDNDEDCRECVGMELGYESLYGNNTLGNTTYSVQLPNTTTGSYYLKAAVPYLVGISGETGINYFNQSLTLVSNAKMRV